MDYLEIRELYHHGIKGQKWGDRNGPPYPLDYEDHSSAEKKDNPKGKLDNYSSEDEKKANKRIKKEAKQVEKEQKTEIKKKQTNEMMNDYARQISSKNRKWFFGPETSSAYQVARYNGEGRIKAGARAIFDLRKSDVFNLPISVATIQAKRFLRENSGQNMIRDMLITVGSAYLRGSIDKAVTKKSHEKGNAASLQEMALRKKYYGK